MNSKLNALFAICKVVWFALLLQNIHIPVDSFNGFCVSVQTMDVEFAFNLFVFFFHVFFVMLFFFFN